MSNQTVQIAQRFCGPPNSGNGGYVCGRVAAALRGAVTVRLLAPPPLGVGLELVVEDDRARLLHGERTIAQAGRSGLTLEAPAAPTLDEAQAASTRYAGFVSHPFPTCFVCGPARAEGDGLRIFPARVPGRELVAAPWTPSANLGDAHGRVRDEFVWSALDCTGFFSFGPLPDGSPALLGELTARIDGELRCGDPYVVSGWLIGADGRKRHAGSAIHDAAGTLKAIARATWIVVAPGTAGAAAAGS